MHGSPTNCFVFTQIVFDNQAHSGQIEVDVQNDVQIYECRDWNVEGSCKFSPKLMQKLNICAFLSIDSRGQCSGGVFVFSRAN